MEFDWTAVAVAVLAAAPGIFMAMQQRRKDKVDVTDRLVDAALKIVQSIKDENERLKRENKELRQENDALKEASGVKRKRPRKTTEAKLKPSPADSD